jgi:hypothetical protein
LKININHWIHCIEVIEKLNSIERKLEKMATKADLDQAIIDLKAAIAQETSEVLAKITDLEAKIAAGQDVTQEVSDLREAIGSIQNIVTPDQPPTP